MVSGVNPAAFAEMYLWLIAEILVEIPVFRVLTDTSPGIDQRLHAEEGLVNCQRLSHERFASTLP